MKRSAAWHLRGITSLTFGLIGLSTLTSAWGAETGRTLLGSGSYWRAHVTWRDTVVALEALKETDPGAAAPQPFGEYTRLTTPPPPAGWARPDFDDAAWPRSPGPFPGVALHNNPYMAHTPRIPNGTLCVRGKFAVDDPAAVKRLTLSLTYRGGVVAYLNGREVCRAHLPAGKRTLSTPGALYPKETYVAANGKLIPSSSYAVTRAVAAGEKDLPGRVARRNRVLGPAELPVTALRKGVNVLAIEVHGSDFRPPARTWSYGGRARTGWHHVGLRAVRLAAEGGGIRPNVSRPDRFQVWNEDPHRMFSVLAYGDPNEPLRPVRLVGARNGTYSGQVVAGSPKTLEGIQAVASELRAARGAGRIPAANVQIRYGAAATFGVYESKAGLSMRRYRWKKIPAFGALEPEPPAKVEPATLETDSAARARLGLPAKATPAAVLPVWITVHIPRDAAPGTYAGTVTLSAAGMPKTVVPVEVEVIGWTLPDPPDFRLYIGLFQSPETLAAFYKVPLWSEKHWALVEKSLRLTGQLGNNLVVLHVLTRTQFGNDEAMVYWIKQPDGSFQHDFTVYDRYMKLARKYCKPRVVSVQVLHAPADWGLVKPDRPKFVTQLDPKTGERSPMQLAAYCTPESKKQLQPVLDAVVARLKKQGLGDKLVLGICADQGIRKDIIRHFAEMLPGVRWHYGAHNRASHMTHVKYTEYLYVPHTLRPPGAKLGRRRTAWWTPHPRGMLIVMSQRIRDPLQPPMVVRTLAERAILLGDKGAGRMCIDYWPIAGRRSRERNLFNRWPTSTVNQRRPTLCSLALPGRDGPVAGIKFEAMREGLQEVEARMFVERALVRGRITGDLATRCRARLEARHQNCRTLHSNYSPRRAALGEGWQKRSAGLYRLAAEVAARAEKRKD